MTEPHLQVLVIEDEAPMRRFLRASLTSSGYQVLEASSASDGLAQAAAYNPDLVLLDLGLPDQDGLEVTERLREWAKMPIIVISARGRDEDKVKALDAGADDYVTKPFSVSELHARIRAALRRTATTETGESRFSAGDIKVDLARREVTVGGQQIHVTPIEYKLLTTLIKHAGRVVTHRQLLQEVWGPNSGDQTQYLRVYMAQLRHKLEHNPSRPQYLLTEPGVGYRLRPED
jgi:two-component system, OmpR family, KDP operon response regulator KdpE